MKILQQLWPIDLYLFSSPVYWPKAEERHVCADGICQSIKSAAGVFGDSLSIHLIDSAEKAEAAALPVDGERATLFLPMSGAVQPWMQHVSARCRNLALLNAYLPDMIEAKSAHAVMHRNAHPSCTDFFAHRRLAGKSCEWIDSVEDLFAYIAGFQAAQRLRHATFIKIGETEPWVINSCRDPDRFMDKWGTRVIPMDRERLYEQMEHICSQRVDALASDWLNKANSLTDITLEDVNKACRVVAAMEDLLDQQGADALSMACFSMIGDINTTSCLALSALNDSAHAIGACEGDLDAAATLFLLRALGADFVWIGNPILHPGSSMELAHCTAPRCACGQNLPYRLMRHHESGRGVAPEVRLPVDREVTLARIGHDLQKISIHTGTTRRMDKMPTCHTQVRVDVGDTREIVNNLLGTHLVMSYGNWKPALRRAAGFLGLEPLPS